MSHSEIYHPSVGVGEGRGRGGGGCEEMGDISDYSCRSLLGLGVKSLSDDC